MIGLWIVGVLGFDPPTITGDMVDEEGVKTGCESEDMLNVSYKL